uniref:Fatty acid desaturase domain-containing protein n=1 Tax=Strigamia maritima TaxID=126957 RepID=T1J8Z5_STRMM
MAPKPNETASTLADAIAGPTETEMKSNDAFKPTYVKRNVLLFLYLHICALYGVYLLLFHAKPASIAWMYVLLVVTTKGITAGAHRLWAHRTYKARLPLRIYLAFANALGFQNSIYEWSRDHRVHHKFSETDADPHNARRGFFFAHVGWLIMRKHPDVLRKGKTVDMSDLLSDPVVRLQKTFYTPLVLVVGILMPTFVPTKLWGEDAITALFVCAFLRLTFSNHVTWLVNSAAHLYGDHPYDLKISPAENVLVSILAMGEGFHNYHHTFPWDYAASEWGWHKNMTKFFIDLWAKLGLAYDLKRVPKDIVLKRKKFNGDGSTPWYDEDSAQEYLKSAD